MLRMRYTGSFESVRLRPDEREIDRRNLDRDMNRVPLEAREETSTVTRYINVVAAC